MAHDINRMIYIGEMPWLGLGVRLPARAGYEEIVQAAGFHEAVHGLLRCSPSPSRRRASHESRRHCRRARRS